MLLDDKAADIKLPPKPSERHLDAILHTMSRLLLQRRTALHTLLDAEAEAGLAGHDIAILTAYWNAQLDERAAKLRRQGNTVAVVDIGGAS
jgi:hypothetical protein